MNDYRREFERFLYEQKTLSDGTRSSYLGDHAVLADFARRKQIDDLSVLTPGDLNAFVRWLTTAEKAPATVNRAISSVRCFFSALESYGVIRGNPAERLVGAKLPAGNRQPVSEKEYARLLEQIDANTLCGSRDRAMIALLRRTPVRLNDLLQTNLRDVDASAGRLFCGKSAVSLPHGEAEALRRYLCFRRQPQHDGEEALFLNQYGKRMSRQGFWKQMKQYALRAGLADRITPGSIGFRACTLRDAHNDAEP